MDMERTVSTITDYINFCRDTVIPVRTVRCYPNNKPWITSDIKDLLNQKKTAFQNGDGERRRDGDRSDVAVNYRDGVSGAAGQRRTSGGAAYRSPAVSLPFSCTPP